MQALVYDNKIRISLALDHYARTTKTFKFKLTTVQEPAASRPSIKFQDILKSTAKRLDANCTHNADFVT